MGRPMTPRAGPPSVRPTITPAATPSSGGSRVVLKITNPNTGEAVNLDKFRKPKEDKKEETSESKGEENVKESDAIAKEVKAEKKETTAAPAAKEVVPVSKEVKPKEEKKQVAAAAVAPAVTPAPVPAVVKPVTPAPAPKPTPAPAAVAAPVAVPKPAAATPAPVPKPAPASVPAAAPTPAATLTTPSSSPSKPAAPVTPSAPSRAVLRNPVTGEVIDFKNLATTKAAADVSPAKPEKKVEAVAPATVAAPVVAAAASRSRSASPSKEDEAAKNKKKLKETLKHADEKTAASSELDAFVAAPPSPKRASSPPPKIVTNKNEVEEGEIVEDVNVSESQKKLIATISNMKRDEYMSFFVSKILPTIFYPAEKVSAEERPKVQGGAASYSRKFLMALKSKCNDKPEPLDLNVLADAVATTPRPGSSGDRRKSSASHMQRQGSQGDIRNTAGTTSDERFRQAMAKHSMAVPGVMSGVGGRGMVMGGRSMSSGPMMPGTMNFQGGVSKKSGGARPDMSGGRGRGRGGRGGKSYHAQQQAEENLPPVEPLKASENAWKPGMKEEVEDPEIAKLKEVSKKVKGILNKLTYERFESLSNQILNIGIDNPDILKEVISLIYDKATDEPGFAKMYAELCFKLSNELPQVQSWVLDTEEERNNMFRRCLLNQCQQEFEKGSKWTERKVYEKKIEDMTAEEKEQVALDEEARMKLKRRALGNIMFIGELFKLGMIGKRIMHGCVTQLLKNVEDPEEEEIESLCKLLTTIGSTLDIPEAKSHMDKYFERIVKLADNTRLESRIRFMLKDVMDLRKSRWVLRQKKDGPKTIAEIREDAERQARIQAENIRMQRNNSGRGGNQSYGMDKQYSGGRRGDGRQDSRDSRDGWNAVGKSGTPTSSIDVTKIGFSKSKVATDITLGPGGGAGGWTGGARGWNSKDKDKKDSAQKEEKGEERPTNMFSILGETGERKKSVDEGHKPEGITIKGRAAAAEPAKAAPAPEKLTKKQADLRIKNMIDEWFAAFDVKEAKETIKELQSTEYNSQIVGDFLNKTLETNAGTVKKTADLYVRLFKDGVLSKANFVDG